MKIALSVLVAAQKLLWASLWKPCAYLAYLEPESITILHQFVATDEVLLLSRNAGGKTSATIAPFVYC